MRIFFVLMLLLLAGGMATQARTESALQVLEGIGNAANALNEEALNYFDGNNAKPDSYAAAMARARKLEAIKVHELAEAAGVNPEIIREKRQNGETWEQIASTYNVDLASLPNPEEALQQPGILDAP